jgi:hypothetical protein
MPSLFSPNPLCKTQLVIFCIMLLCAWLPVSTVLSMAHQPLPIALQIHNPLDVSDVSLDVEPQIAAHAHGHASFDHTHDLPQWFVIKASLAEAAQAMWTRTEPIEPSSASISPAKKPPKSPSMT